MNTSTFLICLILVIIGTTLGMYLAKDESNVHNSAIVTVTDKQPYGSEQIQIFNGSNIYRAPGYLWNDIEIGQSYNMSYIDFQFLGDDRSWVTVITMVDNQSVGSE